MYEVISKAKTWKSAMKGVSLYRLLVSKFLTFQQQYYELFIRLQVVNSAAILFS